MTVDDRSVLWHVGQSLRLGMPLALSHLAVMGMTATDILMMGWLGAEALAAGALAGHMIGILYLIVNGISGAAAPLMARALGGGDAAVARGLLRDGLWLGLGLGAAAGLALWPMGLYLSWLGQPDTIALPAQAYARIALFNIPIAIIFSSLRGYAAVFGRPNLGLFAIVLGLMVNAAGNYGLMFGHFGLPRLELRGAAIATVGTEIFMIAVIVLAIRRVPDLRALGLQKYLPGRTGIGEILRLGLPIGVMNFGEIGVFQAATFAIALFGAAQIAGHAVAMECAGIAFAIPLALRQAAEIRIGFYAGAGQHAALRRAARAVILAGTIGGLVLAATFWSSRAFIAGLFLDPGDGQNAAAFTAAIGMLVVLAIFQIADGPQQVFSGILRGLKDTRWPMIILLAGNWLVGAPLGLFLAFALGLQGAGMWTGMAVGIALTATALGFRLRNHREF